MRGSLEFAVLILAASTLLISNSWAAHAPTSDGIATPSWNMPYLLPIEKDGGAPVMPNLEFLRLFYATKDLGTYNMSPMLSFLNGMFLATFKNSPEGEDQAGQRVLYSQSLDGGQSWTDPTNNAQLNATLSTWSASDVHYGVPVGEKNDVRVLFPNISTSSNPAALFAEPTVLINGRAYAAASPTQFCLYPDQYASVLLLRRVFDGQLDSFGPMFWASKQVPTGWEDNSQVHGIPTVLSMDAQTQSDVALLLTNSTYRPCDPSPTDAGHTTKCEWCPDGCQNWTDVEHEVPITEGERSHYLLPDGAGDVLLYRTKSKSLPNFLYASVRPSFSAPWPAPTATNITDDVSNLNSGNLPDGRAYLVSNVLVTIARNPLFLSTTDESNMRFVETHVIANCFDDVFVSDRQPVGCMYRHRGDAKEGGCQYPQALAVTKGYFHGIFSLNKEDIWMLRFPVSQA